MLLKFCVVETFGEQLLVSKPAALMMIVNSRNSLAWKRPVVEMGNTQVQFMGCMGSGMYEGTAMPEVVCSYWLWRCPSSLKSIPPFFCQVLEEVTPLSQLHTFSPMLNVFIFQDRMPECRMRGLQILITLLNYLFPLFVKNGRDEETSLFISSLCSCSHFLSSPQISEQRVSFCIILLFVVL